MHESSTARAIYTQDPNGKCGCRDDPRYGKHCRVASGSHAGTCKKMTSSEERAPDGSCLPAKGYCIRRWVMKADHTFDTQPVLAGKEPYADLAVGADKVSCACDKKQGYCFSKVNNKCERFDLNDKFLTNDPSHSGHRRRTPAHALQKPPAPTKILVNGTAENTWFGIDKNQMCVQSTSPFVGQGCRIWRSNHKCKKMLGLAAVRKNHIRSCAQEARAEKRCYRGPKHSSVIMVRSFDRLSGVQMCYCSIDACEETKPDNKWNTVVCGKTDDE